jgi:hypothetical protein
MIRQVMNASKTAKLCESTRLMCRPRREVFST